MPKLLPYQLEKLWILLEGISGIIPSIPQKTDLEREIYAVALEQECTPLELIQAWKADPQAQSLKPILQLLTISETHFYRVPAQMQALEQEILPQLLERAAVKRCLRLWSVGCSSGEEVYTLAILLEEVAQKMGIALGQWDIEIWGSDYNFHNLQRCRQAIYKRWSFRGTPEHWKDQYFKALHTTLEPSFDHAWQVADRLRRWVRFEHLNLMAPQWPPLPLSCDLIVCRNVTIYFNAERTQGVYQRLAQRLRPLGWLLLGPSDPPPNEVSVLHSGLKRRFFSGAVMWQYRALNHELKHELNAPSLALESPSGIRIPSSIPPSIPSSHLTDLTDYNPISLEQDALDLTETQQITPESTLELEVWYLPLQQGMQALERQDWEVALLNLRQAAFLQADHPLLHLLLGQVWIRLEQPKRAKAALSQSLLLLSPRDHEEPLGWGETLRVGEMREAAGALLTSLEALI